MYDVEALRRKPGLRFGTKIAVTIAHTMNAIATVSRTVSPSVVRAETAASRGRYHAPSGSFARERRSIDEKVNRVCLGDTRRAPRPVCPPRGRGGGQSPARSIPPNLRPTGALPFVGDRRVAYERGARYVETHYRDMHLGAPGPARADDSLDWSPPWTLSLLDHMIETRGATIAITGESEPELLADLDHVAPRARAQGSPRRSCSTPRTGG